MSYIGTLATLAGVLALGVISPGPNFVVVTSMAMRASRRAGISAGLGLAAASLTWTLLSMAGLGLLLAQVPWIYEGVRLIGAAYLIWLGAKMVLGARRPLADAGIADTVAFWPAMRRAYLVSMSSPKSLAFYGSIFAVMVPGAAPLWVYTAILVIATGVSALWYCSLALMFSDGRVRRGFTRVKAPAETIMGLCLVGLGGRLLASR